MFVTVYSKAITRRATGKKTIVGCAYSTKSLTSMHEYIRSKHSDAETYKDPERVITHFIAGVPLCTKPLVLGGQRIS